MTARLRVVQWRLSRKINNSAIKKRPFGLFENGRGDLTRTGDLAVPNRARYQLRHAPTICNYSTKYHQLMELGYFLRFTCLEYGRRLDLRWHQASEWRLALEPVWHLQYSPDWWPAFLAHRLRLELHLNQLGSRLRLHS